ncbi:MAG: hypothetical protein K2X98_00280 [Alphaproteobacteria bacterium]|nr:hypothetical protein [Alphaproteobacteria bacterium]
MKKTLLTAALLITSASLQTAFSMDDITTTEQQKPTLTTRYFPDADARIKFTWNGLKKHADEDIKDRYSPLYASQLVQFIEEMGCLHLTDQETQQKLYETKGDLEIEFPTPLTVKDLANVWTHQSVILSTLKSAYGVKEPVTEGTVYDEYIGLCKHLNRQPQAFYSEDAGTQHIMEMLPGVLGTLSIMNEKNILLTRESESNQKTIADLKQTIQEGKATTEELRANTEELRANYDKLEKAHEKLSSVKNELDEALQSLTLAKAELEKKLEVAIHELLERKELCSALSHNLEVSKQIFEQVKSLSEKGLENVSNNQ